jgi:predicted NBD/HSP70 family sugar kinase
VAAKRPQPEEIVYHNQYVVMDLVRKFAPLSRADIVRRTGLAVQTVSNIAETLLRADFVIEERRRDTGRGQPPLDLRINPSARYAVGVALDGRGLIAAICDFVGEERVCLEEDLPNMHPDTVLPRVAAATARLVATAGVDPARVLGLGLVMPGLTERGRFGTLVREHPWRDHWRDRAFTQELSTATGLPVLTDNDRTAAALSERLSGLGRAYENFLYVYFGPGIGGGLIFAGIPYRGRDGRAGEIGHMVVAPGGRLCSCGNRGCLERYASLQALQSALTGKPYDAEPIDPGRLVAAVTEGHPVAMAWLDEAAAHLGTAIVSLENILDVDAVFLGGVIPDPILDALMSRLTPLPPSVYSSRDGDQPRIRRAGIGRRAAARGAAALVVLNATVPDFSLLGSEAGASARPGARTQKAENTAP